MNIPGDYALGVDVWEGSLNIDEAVLKAAGVEHIWIRLNDTVGSLHLDANFSNQWQQAAGFKRAAYFVIGDWYAKEIQRDFILANLPSDCQVISLDVELHYALNPSAYSIMVKWLISELRAHGLTVVVYTGGWFLPYVSPWPADVDYWWARYPYALYPASSIEITWDTLIGKLAALNWGPGTAPGHVAIWQCSGDRFKLPGCAGRAMDINIMPRADFDRIFAATSQVYLPIVINPVPIGEWAVAADAWMREKGYAGPGPA